MRGVVGMGLGARIRGLREEIGMSQAELASQAELSQGYLSQIENDEVRNPSASVLFRLAQSLHVDPRCLLEAAGFKVGLVVTVVDRLEGGAEALAEKGT